jgi:hypothetical protein
VATSCFENLVPSYGKYVPFCFPRRACPITHNVSKISATSFASARLNAFATSAGVIGFAALRITSETAFTRSANDFGHACFATFACLEGRDPRVPDFLLSVRFNVGAPVVWILVFRTQPADFSFCFFARVLRVERHQAYSARSSLGRDPRRVPLPKHFRPRDGFLPKAGANKVAQRKDHLVCDVVVRV